MSHIRKQKILNHDPDRVIFHLRKHFNQEEINLFPTSAKRLSQESIFSHLLYGYKDTEYRDGTKYWFKRLTKYLDPDQTNFDLFFPRWGGDKGSKHVADLTGSLVVHKAWFVEGYPKNNLPRLEAKITGLWYSTMSKKLGIVVSGIVEVKEI